MSLLTPVKVPVKVYRWDDEGAPVLDRTPNCMATIFKACLVTGYGTKEPAGWTMPFEDTAAGIKVLRPELSPHTDFYLRVSADTGTEMVAQVYLNMTDANTGDLKLQCATPFKYAKATPTGKWLLIASPRGVWFFCEQPYKAAANKSGAFFYCGDLAGLAADARPVYLHHTGGTYTDGDYASITKVHNVTPNASQYVDGHIYDGVATSVPETVFLFGGSKVFASDDHASMFYIIKDLKMYALPGFFVPVAGAKYNNFAILNMPDNQKLCVFGASGKINTNYYLSLDFWEY